MRYSPPQGGVEVYGCAPTTLAHAGGTQQVAHSRAAGTAPVLTSHLVVGV